MNAFVSGVVVLGAIAMASAGIISPHVSYVSGLSHGYVASPLVASVAVHAPEGQYLHDYTEKLYDDGSYRPELRAIPLANSPYGLTPAGSGLEGAYVPDINEKLYDDGSYRPELRAIPLANSPYGLTPAGSGLEGAYVHDISEKLYDDGSYRPGHLHH
ncbi:unnamed protein product [Ceutorhynchus assimilis]|uniref:Uncharacterized protein n=1 Tax=Ceutorhynchus assimilis TaxID=467358 RepID=A0A9P0DHT4_9CUCU|nr:unnamed protein product [Ceutorhynchus assimilis]